MEARSTEEPADDPSARPIEAVATVMGWVTLASFVPVSATGVWLQFFYSPNAAQAWDDISALQRQISWGLWVRNLHRFTSIGIGIGMDSAGARSPASAGRPVLTSVR